MPKWSRTLPDDAKGVGLPIRRTPARRPLRAIVTSEDLVGTYTHFWKGRTVPCEKPDCEPCNKGMPYRWHAYMTCWEPDAALHFLFEVTAQAAEHFVSYRDAYGTLRGCFFQAARWRSTPNGRVLIRCKPDDMLARRLPNPPDLIAVLSVLWNLPTTDLALTPADPDRKTNRAAASHLERVLAPYNL